MITLERKTSKSFKTAMELNHSSIIKALEAGKNVIIKYDSRTGEIKIQSQKVEKI